MTLVNYMPLRGRCSHCHSRAIRPLEDGWLCLDCNQIGIPPVCPFGCILDWKGMPISDCRMPESKTCYQAETDKDLYNR